MGGIDYSSLVQKHMSNFSSYTNLTTSTSSYSTQSTANQIADALLGVGSMVAMMAIASKADASSSAATAQAADNTNFASATSAADTALSSYTSALAELDGEKAILQDLKDRLTNVQNKSTLETKKNDLVSYETNNTQALNTYTTAKTKVDNLTALQTKFNELNPQIEAQDRIINAGKPSNQTIVGVPLDSSNGGNVGRVENAYSETSDWSETKPDAKKGFVVRQQEIADGNGKKTQYKLEVNELQRQSDIDAAMKMDQYVADVANAKATKTQLESQLETARGKTGLSTPLTANMISSALLAAQTELSNADVVLNNPEGKTDTYTVSQLRTAQSEVQSEIDQASVDTEADLNKQITAQKAKVTTADSKCKAAKTVLMQQRTSLQAMLTAMKPAATAAQRLNTAQTSLQDDHDYGTDGHQRTKWQKFWNAGRKDKANIKVDKKLAKQAKQNYTTAQENFTSANNFAFNPARYQAIQQKIQLIDAELAKYTAPTTTTTTT